MRSTKVTEERISPRGKKQTTVFSAQSNPILARAVEAERKKGKGKTLAQAMRAVRRNKAVMAEAREWARQAVGEAAPVQTSAQAEPEPAAAAPTTEDVAQDRHLFRRYLLAVIRGGFNHLDGLTVEELVDVSCLIPPEVYVTPSAWHRNRFPDAE